jgi:sulfate/thiosulfate transport system permease protein
MPKLRRHSVIPGFGLTLGYSVSYLSLIVLIPLSAVVVRGAAQPWAQVVIALAFIGLPFIVRTVQPTIEDLDPAVEEAAILLGASRFTTFRRVILPAVQPTLIAGFVTAFARCLGEYGSVIFISGKMPMRTEIASLLIVTKLEQFDYAGASAIALLMLVSSFLLLFLVNFGQWWSTRAQRREA